MRYIDRMFLPDDFINSLPDPVKSKVLEYDVLDFAFEEYKKVFRDYALGTINPLKFFVPYGSNRELFLDYSTDDDHNIIREPTKDELAEKGKTIPLLPNNWYNAFLLHYKEPMIQENKKRPKANIKTLAVFDFDDTLFKSKEAAERLGAKSHLSPDSLPDKADDSDWNLDIVYKAQELCSNPSIYCVMMTGRVGKFFEEKINKLLRDRNILFAETHYNEFGGDTGKYKKETIYNILDKLPNIKNLAMWEDKEDKAEEYIEEFADKLNFKIHMVNKEEK